MSRKMRVIVIIGFLIFLLVIVLLAKKSSQAPQLESNGFKQLPVNNDVSVIDQINEVIYFSNGRYLVSYNKKTGESKRLTNTSTISKVSAIKVSPDGKYVAFKTSDEVLSNKPFSEIIYELETSDPQNIWWLANTQTGQVSFIGTNIPSLVWSDSQNYLYSLETRIYRQQVSSQQPTILYEGKGIIDAVLFNNNTIYFNEIDGMFGKLTDDKKPEKISDYATRVLGGKEPSCFLYTRSVDYADESNNTVEGCSKRKVKINKGILSSAFTDDGKYLLFYSQEEDSSLGAGYIDLATGKEGAWKLDDSIEEEQDIEVISAESLDDVLLRVKQKYYTQNTSQKNMIKTAGSLTAGSIKIDLSKENSKVIASKRGVFSDADKSSVETAVQAVGYDTNLLIFDFSVLKEDNNRFN